jgi:hypothetical protein
MPATVAAAARRSKVRTTPLARQGALRPETGFPEGFGEVKAPLSSYHLTSAARLLMASLPAVQTRRSRVSAGKPASTPWPPAGRPFLTNLDCMGITRAARRWLRCWPAKLAGGLFRSLPTISARGNRGYRARDQFWGHFESRRSAMRAAPRTTTALARKTAPKPAEPAMSPSAGLPSPSATSRKAV